MSTVGLRKRAFVLAFCLFMIPIAALMAGTVLRSTLAGSGYARQEQIACQNFFLAESGIEWAFHFFAANNFSAYTHEPDGSPRDSSAPGFLVNPNLPQFALDSEGWYQWKWNPGDDLSDSYTRTGREESFRFRVFSPSDQPPGHYRIQVESRVGNITNRHRLEGRVDSALNYSIFDNGDLSDFTRSTNESLSGKVHANGDIYLRPYQTNGLSMLIFTVMDSTNPTLEIFTDELSSGGRIIRHKDIWEQSDDGGRVRVTNSTTGKASPMEGAAEGAVGEGVAYDSFHDDWGSSGPNGAVERWDGAVKDLALGAKVVSSPTIDTFLPGGFYDQKAELHVDEASTAPYLSDKSFYNEAEERLVKVKEIDVAALAASGAWPSNGLLYSTVPLRLVNGDRLPQELSVATPATIYVKGDFNKEFPTAASRAAGVSEHKPVALMTADRIYRLSENFPDKSGPDYPSMMELLTGAGLPETSDPPSYPGDDVDTLEINAAMVDGAPTNDVRAWRDDPDNTFFIEKTGLNIPGKGFLERKAKQLPSSPGKLLVAFPQSEDLLENFQNVKFKGLGSVAHLRIADMAKFDNSDADSGKTPWVVKSAYIPPDDDTGGYDFRHDSNLASAPGGLSPAPFAPMVAHRLLWAPR